MGRETSMCGCLSCAPYWGPNPQPRHVPPFPPSPWNQTGSPLMSRPALNPLSHTSQGYKGFLKHNNNKNTNLILKLRKELYRHIKMIYTAKQHMRKCSTSCHQGYTNSSNNDIPLQNYYNDQNPEY